MPASGPNPARMLIVGLAPGRHGANKTGVPFTGDASGQLLFEVLEELAISHKVAITNAVKCVPPENAPLNSEFKNCFKFLRPEIELHRRQQGAKSILCLGQGAYRMTLKALDLTQAVQPFAHGHRFKLDELGVTASYHCSRYNIQTKRLTKDMFLSAVKSAAMDAGLIT